LKVPKLVRRPLMRNVLVEINPRKIQYLTLVTQEEATDGSLVYRAEIPDLPGCMSHGDTREEALQNLEEAMDLYIETLVEQGRPIPPTPLKAPVTLGTGSFDQESDISVQITHVRQKTAV
jgi:predicted RNase H-like HicB family nuclease